MFLALPVLLLIVFTYISFVDMFKNSLTDWDGISETSNFVGLKNLRALTSLQTMQQASTIRENGLMKIKLLSSILTRVHSTRSI